MHHMHRQAVLLQHAQRGRRHDIAAMQHRFSAARFGGRHRMIEQMAIIVTIKVDTEFYDRHKKRRQKKRAC